MRFKVAALAVCLCSFVGMGLSVRMAAKGQIHSRSSVRAMMLADGGEPVPPWPPSGLTLLADGGEPVPPWPPSGSVLLADGGEPVPPWPSGSILFSRTVLA